MTAQTKKTAYLMGVGGSMLVLCVAIVAQQSGKQNTDIQIADNTNQFSNEGNSNTEVVTNTNTEPVNTNTEQINQNINTEVVNQNTNSVVSSNQNTNTAPTNTNTNTNTVVNTNTTKPVNTNTAKPTNTNTTPAPTGATGTYSATASYSVPGGQKNNCTVSVTLSNNVVTAVSVTHTAHSGDSRAYQASFDRAYKAQVVGKSISSVRLSRVGGATLTTNGFNQAIASIASRL